MLAVLVCLECSWRGLGMLLECFPGAATMLVKWSCAGWGPCHSSMYCPVCVCDAGMSRTKPLTLNPTPYTLHPTPYTLSPKP